MLRNCKVGSFNYIGLEAYLNHVLMGNYCSIAGKVTIGAMEHSFWTGSTSTFLSDEGYSSKTTTIGHDVWIGTQVVIRQGVKIGTGAVVGANSFVNKDVPPYAIVVGSPARILRYRFGDDTIKKLLESKFWLYAPEQAKDILNKIPLQTLQ